MTTKRYEGTGHGGTLDERINAFRKATASTAMRCTYCGNSRPGRYRSADETNGTGRGSAGRARSFWICGPCDVAQGTAPTRDVAKEEM